jgi:hypothetical protein
MQSKCSGCGLEMRSGSRYAPPDVCTRLQLNGTYIDAIFEDDGAGTCFRCSRPSSSHYFGENPFFEEGEHVGHCMNRAYEKFCCLCLTQIDCQTLFGRSMNLDYEGCTRCQNRDESLRLKMLAFVMSSHPRLGQESNANVIFSVIDGSSILRSLVFESHLIIRHPEVADLPKIVAKPSH